MMVAHRTRPSRGRPITGSPNFSAILHPRCYALHDAVIRQDSAPLLEKTVGKPCSKAG